MTRRRPIRVTREMHDRCLRACTLHKDQLTAAEIQTLNLIANNWAACFPTSFKFVSAGTAILLRLGI